MASTQSALRATMDFLINNEPCRLQWSHLFGNAYVVTLRDTPSISVQARPTPEAIAALMPIVQEYNGLFEIKQDEINFEMSFKTPFNEPAIRIQIHLM